MTKVWFEFSFNKPESLSFSNPIGLNSTSIETLTDLTHTLLQGIVIYYNAMHKTHTQWKNAYNPVQITNV